MLWSFNSTLVERPLCCDSQTPLVLSWFVLPVELLSSITNPPRNFLSVNGDNVCDVHHATMRITLWWFWLPSIYDILRARGLVPHFPGYCWRRIMPLKYLLATDAGAAGTTRDRYFHGLSTACPRWRGACQMAFRGTLIIYVCLVANGPLQGTTFSPV